MVYNTKPKKRVDRIFFCVFNSVLGVVAANKHTNNHIPYCLVARISGFHPEGPGSIPGMGNFFSISPVKDGDFVHTYNK